MTPEEARDLSHKFYDKLADVVVEGVNAHEDKLTNGPVLAAYMAALKLTAMLAHRLGIPADSSSEDYRVLLRATSDSSDEEKADPTKH